jgi:hypothetical protein
MRETSPGVGVHGVEGVVGAEHAHTEERHAADGYVLDRVGLLVGIVACCCVVGQGVRVDPRGRRPAFQRVIELVRLEKVFVLAGEADQRGISRQRGPITSEDGRHQPTVVSSAAPARPDARRGAGWRRTVAERVPGLLRLRLQDPVEVSEASSRITGDGAESGPPALKSSTSLVCAGVVTAQPGVQAC